MNRDVSGEAESAVRVGLVAVCVIVRDLNGTKDNHQKNAHHREEESPRMVGAILSDDSTHTIQL
jgi:hypothetical protein